MKTLFFISFVIFILSVVNVIFIFSEHNKILKNSIKKQNKIISKYISLYVDKQINLAKYFHHDISKDSFLIYSFFNREHDYLYTYSKSYFNQLNKINSNFNNMHYYLPNNKSFLRMHKKDAFGDNLSFSRPIVSHVNKTKIPIHGFELGRYGFYLRVINPIYFGTKYIGALGLGSNLINLTEDLKTLTDSIPLLLVRQNKILENNINIHQDVLQDNNNIIFKPKQDLDYINYIIKNIDFDILEKEEYRIVKYKNSQYLVHNAFMINDFNDKAIGKIINIINITDDVSILYHEMFISILINTFMFIFILFILNHILKKYINDFKGLEHKYNTMVMRMKNISRNLNPHFLFNALNVLSELIYKDPKKADHTIVKLSSFIRSSLRSNSLISIEKELEFVSNYLDIQMIRFENQVRYKLDIEDNNILDRKIPKFAIQLLVENIFKHAIVNEKTMDINITIKHTKLNRIEIIVSDNGKGFKDIEKGFGLTSLDQVIKCYCNGELSYWSDDNHTYFKINIKECNENINS